MLEKIIAGSVGVLGGSASMLLGILKGAASAEGMAEDFRILTNTIPASICAIAGAIDAHRIINLPGEEITKNTKGSLILVGAAIGFTLSYLVYGTLYSEMYLIETIKNKYM